MKYTYRDMYNEVIMSGKYKSKIDRLQRLAQLIYANGNLKNKRECAWLALERHEEMTGVFYDPTQSEFDEIVNSIL